jgi:hypothetical protein
MVIYEMKLQGTVGLPLAFKMRYMPVMLTAAACTLTNIK